MAWVSCMPILDCSAAVVEEEDGRRWEWLGFCRRWNEALLISST
jgi:hypothetical protein